MEAIVLKILSYAPHCIITNVLLRRDYMNGAAEAPDGSYVLAFGHLGGKRSIVKLNPKSS